jgi:hypothetical protein
MSDPKDEVTKGALIHDILGVKAVADATLVVTKSMVDGASAFLSRVCLPAAEEFGDWMKWEVQHFRKRRENAIRIADRARRMVEANEKKERLTAPPRLVAQVIEMGSWSEEEELQQMWAGLLASACTGDGKDDTNVMFTDMLNRMTLSQVRLFQYICTTSPKHLGDQGPLSGGDVDGNVEVLRKISQLDDILDIHRDLGHLHGLGLINENYNYLFDDIQISPTTLGLYMFMRCSGHTGSVAKFYGLGE